MTQLPGYNLYAIPRSEVRDAAMSHLDDDKFLRWEPLNLTAWYLCRLDEQQRITLVGGPYRDEQRALSEARDMVDTSGT